MASTYDPLLRLELQATGENINTWGEKTNTNLELLADAIAGFTSINVAGSGNYTLTTSNGAPDEARSAFIRLSGLLTGNRVIVVPSAAKIYFFHNNTTGSYTVTVKTAGGAAATLPQGYVLAVACDGTDCFDASEVARVSKTGDTMTGPLVLPGNPTVALQATPKQYVDALLPSGTRLLFVQSAAPLGWTKDTSPGLDHAIRVTGGAAGWGGSAAFTSIFASRGLSGSVHGHTLSWNEMPVHNHSAWTDAQGGHSHTVADRINAGGIEGNVNGPNSGGSDITRTTSWVDNHAHNVGVGDAGAGWAHAHGLTINNLDMNVQYVDVIIATKDAPA